jgi:hypothetical protein
MFPIVEPALQPFHNHTPRLVIAVPIDRRLNAFVAASAQDLIPLRFERVLKLLLDSLACQALSQ